MTLNQSLPDKGGRISKSEELTASGNQADKPSGSSVTYKLKLHNEVDYERPYTGKTHTVDTAVGILSGVKVTNSDDTTTSYAPKIIVSAIPSHRIERIAEVPDSLEWSGEVTLGTFREIKHDTKAIVIKDTDDDPLMTKEPVDTSYSYAMGLGKVEIHGYKYVPWFDKLEHKIRAATHELGVSEQLQERVSDLAKNSLEELRTYTKSAFTSKEDKA